MRFKLEKMPMKGVKRENSGRYRRNKQRSRRTTRQWHDQLGAEKPRKRVLKELNY